MFWCIYLCIELPIQEHKSLDDKFTRTFRRVPYPHIALTTSRHKLRALGVVVDAKYIARMSFEDFACQALPHTHAQNTPRLST